MSETMPEVSHSRDRFLLGFTTCIAFFLTLNLLSYFFRSDMFGIPGWQDSIKRVGFPFLCFEEGGFAYRHHFDLAKLLMNAAVGILVSIGGALVWTRLKE